MISFVCEEIQHPVRSIAEAKFGNLPKRQYRGRAYGETGRFIVKLGYDKDFPCTASRFGYTTVTHDRVDALVMVTAHEVFHLKQIKDGLSVTERDADWHMRAVLKKFREKRKSFLAAWSKPPVQKIRSGVPKKSKDQRKFEHVTKKFKEWSRKESLAKTKKLKYARQKKYYEKKLIDG